MTANTPQSDYMRLELIKAENANIMQNVTELINERDDYNLTEDYNKILKLTAMSIRMHANSSFKGTETLELNEIEKIKASLANYTNHHKKVEEFKNEIIDDLTDFQKRIRSTHIQRIVDLTKQKQLCEMELNSLTNEMSKLSKGNLFQIIWPANSATKEYESKIAMMQAKIQQIKQKITSMEQTKPIATEKDILMYRMHIKEKYTR